MGQRVYKGEPRDTTVACCICGKRFEPDPIHDLYCEEHRYCGELDSKLIMTADRESCHALIEALMRDSMRECITAIKKIRKIPNGEKTEKEQYELFKLKNQYEYEKRYLTEFAGTPGRFTWETMWLLIAENEERLRTRLRKTIRKVKEKNYYCWKNPITDHCFALEPVYLAGKEEEDVWVEDEETEIC